MNRDILVKMSFLLMALALAEKLLGFARDQTIAFFFGAGPVTDAYYLALTCATVLLYVVGGTFSTALVPVLTPLWERHRGAGWHTAVSVGLAYVAITLTVGAAVTLGAPWLLAHVLAPGLPATTRPLAVELLRALGIGFVFWAIAAFLAAVLNSRKAFIFPACGPIAFNVAMLAVVLLASRHHGVSALAAGSVLGMLAQLFIQIPPTLGAWSREHGEQADMTEAGRRVWILAGPVLATSLLSQAPPVVDKAIASGLAIGSVSILAFAQKLMQLPIGLVVGAVATVSYTSLSEAWGRRDAEMSADHLGLAIGVTLLLTIPAAVGLAELGLPLVQFVFQHGQFSPAAAVVTSEALVYYCAGLPLVAIHYVLINNAFASKDMRSPIVGYVAALVVNALGDWTLSRVMGAPGIALASSLGAAALDLYLVAAWGAGFRIAVGRSLKASLRTAVGSSGVMSIVVFALAAQVAHGPIWVRLGLPAVCGIVVYAALLFWKPPRELGLLMTRAKRADHA